METHQKTYWCHNCRVQFSVPSETVVCSRCRSELIEEVELNSAHPSQFRPEGIAHASNHTQVSDSIANMLRHRIQVVRHFNTRLQPQALGPEAISSLPLIEGESISEDFECSICYCGYSKGENARKLPCEHFFHEVCITNWLTRKSTCPVCRSQL